MLRWGRICRNCTPSNCCEEWEGLELECPTCDGRGCEECNDGSFQTGQCPNRFCGSVVTTIDLFDCYSKGILPITGGALDQSASFVEAAKLFQSEETLAKNLPTNG